MLARRKRRRQARQRQDVTPRCYSRPEFDDAECRGAYSSHRESAELEREVASANSGHEQPNFGPAARDINENLEEADCHGEIDRASSSPMLARHVGGAPTRAAGCQMPKGPLVSVPEDDQVFRESMRTLMRSLGYTVETLTSASDFLGSPSLRNRLAA
jgi:hypothetical protein